MAGKTIQIFLPDGNPKGVRKASFLGGNITITQISRNDLNSFKENLKFEGIYILVDNITLEKPEIYIGKGNIFTRLNSHDKTKDFWNTVFFIQQTNKGFDPSHLCYMEHYFINKAKKLKQSISKENHQQPSCPHLSETVEAETQGYIFDIEILLSTLELKCFQPMETEELPDNKIFFCSDRYGSKGSGEYNGKGFLLYKGSICKFNLHKGTKYLPERDGLISNGILKEKNGSYILKENKQFSSVSTAAALVLGRRANGWLEWKNKDGKTLDELIRKEKRGC